MSWCRPLVRVLVCALFAVSAAPARAEQLAGVAELSEPEAAASPAAEEEVGGAKTAETVKAVPDAVAPWGGYRSEIERSWFDGGPDLTSRAAGVRYRALELGVDNIESAARALLVASGTGEEAAGLEACRFAVQLAPDLPMAYMALARSLWAEGEYRAALGQIIAGLRAIPRNLEASLWLIGSLLVMLAAVLVLGSLVFIVWVGISLFGHAAHDLGDLISEEMPTFARTALLGSLLLLPLLLGEGLLGLVLVLFAVGMAYGGSRHRLSLFLAAVLIVVGCYPVTRLAGMALTALDSDPVAAAAQSVIRAMETPEEVALLESAKRDDKLALHALALHARRTAALDEALERYQKLLELNPKDPVVLTSIANLRFRNGQIEDAITLYERAAMLVDSAVIMFDLAHAYARSFQMEKFERAMLKAQAIAADEVIALSGSGDPDFLADLPVPSQRIRDRVLKQSRGDAFVQPVIRALMPGRLGSGWLVTASGFALVSLISLLVAGRYEHSSACERCGRRICNRCDGTVWNSEICEGCHHLFHRPQATEPALRMARLAELRQREVRLEKAALLSSLLLPGAAGLVARRPGLSFMGLLFFAAAVVLLVWRRGVVPDPLAVGSAGPLTLSLLGAMAVFGYLVVVAIGLAARRSL